jgi:hypothetical protein
MTVVNVVPAVRRTAVLLGCVALACAASNVRAQQQTPPQQQQTAPQQPAAQEPPDPFKFPTDTPLLMIISMDPAGGPDFEATMAKVQETLAKSDKPDRKQQAAPWKLTKAETLQGGNVMYMFALDQVVKDVTYSPFLILAEGGMPPADVKALYDKVAPNIKGINILAYKTVLDMGGAAGGH